MEIGPDGSCYGISTGTRWRDADGSTIVVVWVQRTGVVVFRREGAAPEDELVMDVVRFVEACSPLAGADTMGAGRVV
jgi:hypothetical protein